jgi:Ferritin-like domain
VDANRLRRLVADVDREHRRAMASFGVDPDAPIVAETADPPPDRGVAERQSFDRRQVVRRLGGWAAAIAGAGVTVPLLATAAGAQTQPTDTAVNNVGATTSTTPAPIAASTTTTTAPPLAPQTSDLLLLSFAQSVELAAVQLYGMALAKSTISKDTALIGVTFQTHHNAHAQSFNGMAGPAVTGIPNQSLLSSFQGQIDAANTEKDLIAVVLHLEEALAATYTAGLALIIGINPTALIASVLPIEARHAVVLAQALGLSVDTYSPTFEPTTGALTPDQYPIVAR